MRIVKVTKKGCDLYPLGSIWNGDADEKGFKVFGREASWIPNDFLEEEPGAVREWKNIKDCHFCKSIFLKDHPFVDTQQIGEEPMCIRCYEKKYIVGRESYRKALLEEIRQGYSHE